MKNYNILAKALRAGGHTRSKWRKNNQFLKIDKISHDFCLPPINDH